MADKVRNVDEINAQLADLSALVYPPGMRLMYAAVDQIREQDLNAQSMPQKAFDQLIENVKGTGALESIPLCVLQAGVIFIISGHHRVRAARAAGLSHVMILLYEQLPPARVKSKQLAHNSITGKSDPELMKRIWDQIDEIQAKFEAFIDPRVFNSLPQPVSFKPVDVNVHNMAKAVLIAFLPTQKADFDAALEAILPGADFDTVYLANREVFDEWKAALARVRAEVDIVSIPTAIAEMARLAVEALDARQAKAEAEKPASS